MKILVGSTGFVGSNIIAHGNIDAVYNSKNIQDAYGTNPEILIYAGVRAEKYLANNNKQADYDVVLNAFDNIKKINPKKVVLISTIDVYKEPNNVNEESYVDTTNLDPYGCNRYRLEQMVVENFDDCLIVRLPGLFGKNIKKNFLYDAIHIIPNMLDDKKFKELSKQNALIAKSYTKCENSFYKCHVTDKEVKKDLRKIFLEMNFTALSFTDSRGMFQFYNLCYLYEHINIALTKGIKLLNLATEPVSINEIYHRIYGRDFVNELNKPIPYYNFKSIHAERFNGKNGYIFNKEKVLNDIVTFVLKEMQNEL